MTSGKQLARDMERFVNGCSKDDMVDFAEEFTRMHRTLQQKSVGLLIKTIETVSKQTNTDARNEASVKAAKLMIEGYKKELVIDLNKRSSYWALEKAEEFVNSESYDISLMPFI